MTILERLIEYLKPLPGGMYLENAYLTAGLVLVIFALLAWLLLLLFNFYLSRFAHRTETELDDLLFKKTRKPFFFLLLLYGLKLALLHLQINGIVSTIIESGMAVLFLLVLMRISDIIIETWGGKVAAKTSTKIDEILLPFLHKIVKVIFVIICLIWLLHIWGIDVTPYLAGVGISGIILGLALQDSLKNVFGGISLLLDKTYQVGDKVRLESGDVGTISDIGLRSTKMVTFDNEVLYVPNGYMANSRVRNYTRPDPRVRVKLEFTVEYGSSVKIVQKTVLGVISKMEGVLGDPKPAVQFMAMGDFALKFRVVFWIPHWDKEHPKKIEATEKI